ncbi:hypothetical protein ACLB0R_16150 [Sphingomonas sp. GlSt437]|uniref:hypothetical protein n=1 Tax=Sphingomonas sp. GlSt437 TaxID=3389970 RepID=UPI003A84CFD6
MSFQYRAASFAPEASPAIAEPSQALSNGRTPHVFDLPPILHIGMFAGFFVFLGIMWSAFADPELAIPFAIFAILLGAALVVPGLWAHVAPASGTAQTWGDFQRDGIVCATGHVAATAAIAQVMIMPAMLIIWGLAVALIHAFA